jgi:putative ABC transport system permease protein
MWERILWWLRRKQQEQDLEDELRSHLAIEARERLGPETSPEEAERAARRAFGNMPRIMEETRDVWRFGWLEELSQDIRYAFRTLGHNPGFAAIVILTVALGIGATTAVFSVVKAVLLQPLPYKDPDRLVRIIENVPAAESFRGVAMRLPAMSPEEFGWWRERVKTLSHMAVSMPQPHTLMMREANVRLAGARVSAALFPMYGIPPLLGRGFTLQEERADARVIVLNARTWQRYLGSDPAVVNRTIILDDQPYTVIGIMPSEFGEAAFWTPYVIGPTREGTVTFINVTARLADGVALEAAAAEINALGHQLREAPFKAGAPPRFELGRVLDETVAPVRPALRVLIVAVGVVLLIVCANVANLLLTRGSRRHAEIATRQALGASRGRLVRQMLTESIVLAGAGGIAGIGIAYGGVALLKTLAAVQLPAGFGQLRAISLLPRVGEITIDPVVLGFTLAAVILAGLLFGLPPALRLSKPHEVAAARNGGTFNITLRTRAGHTLAAAQLAMATPLLVGAGLLLHSFVNLASVDLGFNGENVLHFDLVLPDHYDAVRKLAIAEQLDLRLRALPGVMAAGFSDGPPLSDRNSGRPYGGFDPPYKNPQDKTQAGPIEQRSVSPSYLRALGVRLIAGRWLDDRDRSTRAPAILVSQSYARYYFDGRDPVGSMLPTRSGPALVAGVVDDVRLNSVQQQAPMAGFVDPRLVLEFADQILAERGRKRGDGGNRFFLTGMSGTLGYAVRVNADPLSIAPEVRRLIREVDASAAADGVMTMEDLIADTSAQPRFYTVLLGIFAAIAAVVAGIGIYGVLSYTVARRTREIGIRVALGAERRQVLGFVMRQGALLVAAGLTMGLIGAAALTRYLSGMLFGITPLDPYTYVSVAAAFAALALLACFIPARRAARLDPLAALRHE